MITIMDAEEISDAVSIERLADGVWIVCLDASVIDERLTYKAAKERALEIERDRKSNQRG